MAPMLLFWNIFPKYFGAFDQNTASLFQKLYRNIGLQEKGQFYQKKWLRS
jgi:hypothetical protein